MHSHASYFKLLALYTHFFHSISSFVELITSLKFLPLKLPISFSCSIDVFLGLPYLFCLLHPYHMPLSVFCILFNKGYCFVSSPIVLFLIQSHFVFPAIFCCCFLYEVLVPVFCQGPLFRSQS